jgi:uncharacterized coiled-coil protein SlyX
MNSSSSGPASTFNIVIENIPSLITPQQAADLAVSRKEEILMDMHQLEHYPLKTREDYAAVRWVQLQMKGLPIIDKYLNDNIKKGYKDFLPADLVDEQLSVDASNLQQVKIEILRDERDAYIEKRIAALEQKIAQLLSLYEEIGLNRREIDIRLGFSEKLKISKAIFQHDENINIHITALQKLFLDLTVLENEIDNANTNMFNPLNIQKEYGIVLPLELVEQTLILDFTDSKQKKIGFNKNALEKYFVDRLAPLNDMVARLSSATNKMGFPHDLNMKPKEFREELNNIRYNLAAVINEKNLKKNVESLRKYAERLENLEAQVHKMDADKFKPKIYKPGCTLFFTNEAVSGQSLQNVMSVQAGSAYILAADGIFYIEDLELADIITKDNLLTNDKSKLAQLGNMTSKISFHNEAPLNPREQRYITMITGHTHQKEIKVTMYINRLSSIWAKAPDLDYSSEESMSRANSFNRNSLSM